MEEQSVKQKKSNLLPIAGALVVVLFIGWIVWLFNDRGSSQANVQQENSAQQATDNTSQTAQTDTSSGNSESTEEVKTVAVEGGSFYYKPNEIRVKKGEKVKIVLTSVDMMHDFVIDELNVKVPITKSGETSTVEFVADQAGTFEYYCSVGQHRKNGQVGKLIVEE